MRFLMILTLTAAVGFPQTPLQHIQATLSTTIKLAKAKAGDSIKAATVAPVQLANGPMLPAASMVVGHIVKVGASSITVVFDQVALEGKHLPVSITLSGVAFMGAPGQKMSSGNSTAHMDSPSGGSLPNDHPLNGGRYSVLEAGNNEVNGVGHESLAEVNAKSSGQATKHGTDVAAHAGSVINLPGLKLTIDDDSPYYSTLDFETKDLQLAKGVQFMFTVR